MLWRRAEPRSPRQSHSGGLLPLTPRRIFTAIPFPLITFYPLHVLFPLRSCSLAWADAAAGQCGEGRSQPGTCQSCPQTPPPPLIPANNPNFSPASCSLHHAALRRGTKSPLLFTAPEALQLHHPPTPQKKAPFYSRGRGEMAQRTTCHQPGSGRAHGAPRSSRKPQHHICGVVCVGEQQLLKAGQRCWRTRDCGCQASLLLFGEKEKQRGWGNQPQIKGVAVRR